jgi:hypothetical protein
VESAVRCNLLEDAADPIPVEDDRIEIDYRPHEIISVLVRTGRVA